MHGSTRLLQANKIKLEKFLQANVYQTIGLAPSGGPVLSSPAKKEPGKKDAAKGGGRSPRPWISPPGYDVGATAAHCTGYQANLRVHPCPVSRWADRLPLRCSLRTAGVTWGWRSWEPLASNGGHAARGRLQRCVFGREVRLGAWRGVQGKGTLGCVRLLRMLTKNFFSSSSSHRPCACAGASLIYPKLD